MNVKKIIKNTFYGILVISLTGTGIAASIIGQYVHQNITSVKKINKIELEQNTNSEIYADDGKTLIWTDAEYQHRPATSENTPEIMISMLLATEDHTFYENQGYSEKAIINTLVSTIKDKIMNTDTARGGSTITQQLIKNIRYLDTDISVIDRKIQEIVLSKHLTNDFTKEEIMLAYLNKVGFLESSYGFNTAMYLLYGEEIQKDKTDPSYLAKYATIIGMLKNPSVYNPRINPEETEKRRDQVLLNALNQNVITENDYNIAKSIPVSQDLKDQGWFTQQVYEVATSNGAYVNSILKQLHQYGYDLKNKQNPIKVISNLNITHNEWLQQEASKPEHYANERQQIAITVVEPSSGKVLAQVGSRFGANAYDLNRATQVSRSSGSTIKPFLSYAPLIEFGNIDENTIWNANTTTYAGTNVTVYNYARIMMGTANTSNSLKWSLNVPAVDALTQQEPWMNETIMSNLGLEDHFVNTNGDFETIHTFSGSQALGIHESTADFASAFAALANNGVSKNNMYVKSVTQNGQTIELDPQSRKSMSPRTASKLLKMLETSTQPDGSARTTAIPEYQGYAVKTGTVGFDDNQPLYYDANHTQYFGTVSQTGLDLIASDQWMSGTTKNAAISIWTGFDDQAIYGDWISPENQARATIFVNAMRYFNQGKDTSQFQFSDERIELTKKEPTKSISLTKVDEINLLSQKEFILPSVLRNQIQATNEQKQFKSDFENNKLGNEYENIQYYYYNDNPLGFGLYKTKKPDDTNFYVIDQSGQIVPE